MSLTAAKVFQTLNNSEDREFTPDHFVAASKQDLPTVKQYADGSLGPDTPYQILIDTLHDYNIKLAETPIGYMLQHPFYYQLAPIPMPAVFYNQMMHKITRGSRYLLETTAETADRDRMVELLYVHTETPYRLSMFKLIMSQIALDLPAPPDWTAEILIGCWTSAEVFTLDQAVPFIEQFHQYATLLKVTLQDLPINDYLQDTGTIRLYHGVEFDDEQYTPTSWTLARKTATFFAGRFNYDSTLRPIYVIELTPEQINEHACFYTDERGEREVFFLQDPRDIDP